MPSEIYTPHNSIEEHIHTSVYFGHIPSFRAHLKNGADPHIAPHDDGKDLFRRVNDLMVSDYEQNQLIGSKMSQILLEHEMKRSQSYLINDKKLEEIPSTNKKTMASSKPFASRIQQNLPGFTNRYLENKNDTKSIVL